MHESQFPYTAAELSAFVLSIDTFIISLKNGQIVRYETQDTNTFYNWLVDNNIRDIVKQPTRLSTSLQLC